MSPLPMLLDVSAVTDAYIAMLHSATGFVVGDNEAPTPPPGQEAPDMPYLLVQHIDGGGVVDAAFDDKANPLQLVYQVDAVGGQRDQAQGAASVAYAATLTRQSSGLFLFPIVAPSGWSVYARSLNTLAGSPHDGPVTDVAHRYNLFVCPA
jgi:hypothetical protein